MLSKTLELIEYQQGAAVAHNFKGLRNACEKFAKTDYYATSISRTTKLMSVTVDMFCTTIILKKNPVMVSNLLENL